MSAPPRGTRRSGALVFLYEQVLEEEFGSFEGFARARRPKRLPRVLSRRRVRALLGAMHGPNALVDRLLYGAGLPRVGMPP